MTSTLRPLLKKDITWLWLDDDESSFLEVKKLLTSKTVIHPFDKEANTFLLTDTSRLHGLGFVLMLRKDDQHFLIRTVWIMFTDANTTMVRHYRIRMHGNTVGN